MSPNDDKSDGYCEAVRNREAERLASPAGRGPPFGLDRYSFQALRW